MNGHGKNKLLVHWCKRKDALSAVERWHYSTTLPRFKLANLGVWEHGRFVGAVIFGCGATPEIGKPFKVRASEAAELVRVALGPKKQSETSQVVAIAVKMLRKQYPRLKVLVSFADQSQNHHGGIYQAMGWAYVGRSRTDYISIKGQIVHPKTLHSRYGVGGQSIPWLRENVDKNARRISQFDKHKYVLPLCDNVRTIVKAKRQPYPKRASEV